MTVRVLGDAVDGTWETLVEVESLAHAESGTRVEGDFYLGLGCFGGCSSASGDLMRVAVP